MKLWKIQKFFGDVVYDLRSRRLLPVVILLLVALVAVPVLISQGSNSSSATIKPASGSANAVPETEQAVMAYLPAGIRNYKQRLDDQSAKNPFRDQFSQPAAAASASSQLNSTVTPPATTGASSAVRSSSVGSATSGSTTVTGTGSPTGKSSPSGGTKKTQKKSKKTYSYSVTVYAGDVSAPLSPFANLAPLTALPSQDSSVVLFYGLSTDHKQALFLVSTKVDSLNGPGSCLPAPDDCALLALPAGASEDLHYSKDDKTYRVAVTRIKRTAK